VVLNLLFILTMGAYQKSRRLYLLFQLDVKEHGLAIHYNEGKQATTCSLATRRKYVSSGHTRHDPPKGMILTQLCGAHYHIWSLSVRAI